MCCQQEILANQTKSLNTYTISHLWRAGHVPKESRAPSEHSPGSSLTCYLLDPRGPQMSPGRYQRRRRVARDHNLIPAHSTSWQDAEGTGSRTLTASVPQPLTSGRKIKFPILASHTPLALLVLSLLKLLCPFFSSH